MIKTKFSVIKIVLTKYSPLSLHKNICIIIGENKK